MRTLLAAALLFSGGAVPGATFGGTGVQGASVNYVALPSWGGPRSRSSSATPAR